MHQSTDSGKNEQITRTASSGDKRPTRFSPPGKDLDTDEDTIFEEVGHFKDRDEMLTDGNRIIQGGDASDIDDTWTYDRYDRLLGDVAQSSEAVDVQLSKVGGIADDVRDSGSHRMGTPAIPLDTRRDEFDELNDHQLQSLADSFGIPERQGLSRDKLIRKIREYEMRGI
jgi:hypothetical protein